jgi:hypothetical protein
MPRYAAVIATGGPRIKLRAHTPDKNCIESWDSRISCVMVRARRRPRSRPPPGGLAKSPSPILFGAHALTGFSGWN